MLIRDKLLISFGAVLFISLFFIIYSFQITQNSIESHLILMETENLEKLFHNLEHTLAEKTILLRVISNTPELVKLLEESNQEFENMSNLSFILESRNSSWNQNSSNFSKKVSNNNLSSTLKILLREDFPHYPLFDEVFLTNKQGVTVGQIGHTSEYIHSDEEWWQKTKQEGTHFGKVGFEKSINKHAYTISVEVNDNNDEFLGIIKSETKINHLIKEGLEDKIGGDLYFFTESGELLSSTSRKNIPNVAESNFSFKKDYEVFGDFLFYKPKGEIIEKVGVYVVIDLSSSHLIKLIGTLQRYAVITSILTFLISSLFALYLSLDISAPLKKLEEEFRNVSKGSYKVSLERGKEDEIGRIIYSFKLMVKKLKDSEEKKKVSRKELEKKVKESTKKLEKSRKQLKERINELEKFRELVIGRELRMIELKDELEKEKRRGD